MLQADLVSMSAAVIRLFLSIDFGLDSGLHRSGCNNDGR